MRKGILCVTLLLLLYSCAKRSTPEGGEKDEIPPKVLSSKPENSSIDFDEKKIRITFDEYIKLEKLNSQLVVSPPIDKSNYSIFPQGGASKHIDIEINEPLSDSTTFVFNFGESIKDNNEGNLLPFYKYVFSTGSYVDSLELKGNIYDSYERKQEGYITAMLYPKNESFNDSTVYKEKPLYKIRGDFLFKDSKKIPYLRDLIDFSYFNGSINLQWKELSSLSHIEGESSFILKDLIIKDSIADSLAFNLLGVLNLKNILGKLANFDLSINEFTSTQLNRVEGDLLFNKSKLRLLSPLFVETNTAKMRWVGQVNKNSKNNLDELDLNLDLRVRVGENLPWYAAILGGLPAVAGSAVINEIFEEDINNLTNYQYEVLGTISEPKLERVKQEIK